MMSYSLRLNLGNSVLPPDRVDHEHSALFERGLPITGKIRCRKCHPLCVIRCGFYQTRWVKRHRYHSLLGMASRETTSSTPWSRALNRVWELWWCEGDL